MGARKVDIVSAHRRAEPTDRCYATATTGLVDAGNWAVSASWDVPADAVSGIYFAKITRLDGTAGENHNPVHRS